MPLLMVIAAAQITAAPPPPTIAPMVSIITPAPATAVATVDVEVRGGNEVLWAGQMRVSDRAGASFTRQQLNAETGKCPAADSYYGAGERSSLSVNMAPIRRGADSGFDLRVSWERPGDAGTCQVRRSIRTIGLAETVTVEPGHEQIVKGDGGLVVRLRRR